MFEGDKVKFAWLERYDAEIFRRLRHCKRRPFWQHWPAGHMRHAQGLGPIEAAERYLSETSFGKQEGVIP
jgi:hypothetical protein